MTRAARDRKADASLAVVMFTVVSGVVLGAVSSRAGSAALCPALPVTAGSVISGQPLSAAQVGDARIIYDVGTSLGLPPRAEVIAIATAMQESALLNVPYGDQDSLGLFQQRPSRGWGSPAQVMDPRYAARAFYARLAQVPGWQSLTLTVAAQDVQRSAYPGAYVRWEPLATGFVATFSGDEALCR